ncbi:hypothetical protein LXA43DRAFT_1103183 [Ganoderma leucocontextum]|nr:hypothetical protein LXA43DRAFT_1103183 [Ganoderma leucocontextum]
MVAVNASSSQSATVFPSGPTPEKALYYVVIGGNRPGIYLERPRHVAEGHHVDLLPIVVTLPNLTDARKVNEINVNIIPKLLDPSPDDPGELLAAIKDSRSITRMCTDKWLKIYGVKVGKLTGIWYGVDWNKHIIPLTKHKAADFRKLDMFKGALEWMLDKAHLLDPDGEESESFERDQVEFEDELRAEVTPEIKPEVKDELTCEDEDETIHIPTLFVIPRRAQARCPQRSIIVVRPPGSKYLHVARGPGPEHLRLALGVPDEAARSPLPEQSDWFPDHPICVAAPPAGFYYEGEAESGRAQTSTSFAHDEVIDVSDDETPQEANLVPVPSADALHHVIRAPAFGADGALITDGNTITFGEYSDAWLDGRRTSPAHRLLILQAYVSCQTTDEFIFVVSRRPLDMLVSEAAILWAHIARGIPPP